MRKNTTKNYSVKSNSSRRKLQKFLPELDKKFFKFSSSKFLHLKILASAPFSTVRREVKS